MNYKGLMKDCMTIMCGLGQSLAEYDNAVPCSEASVVKQSEAIDTALTTALLHFGRITCTATLKLMVMVGILEIWSSKLFFILFVVALKGELAQVMELDSSKKYADMQGHTTRVDGVRYYFLSFIFSVVYSLSS